MRNQQLRRLRQLVADTATPVAERLARIAALTRVAFGVDLCVIRESDGDALRLVGADGVSAERLCPVYSANVGLARLVVENRRAMCVEDAVTHPAITPRLQRRIPFVSCAGAPLFVGENLVGTLSIYTLTEPRRFTEADLRHLENVAKYTALVLAGVTAPPPPTSAAPRTETVGPEAIPEDAVPATERADHRFRSLIELTSDGVWEMDREGVFTYVSQRVAESLGCLPETLYGRTLEDVIYRAADEWRDPDAVRATNDALQHWNSLLKEPRRFTGWQATLRRADGQPVRIETSGLPIYGDDGHWFGYRGVSRDVTAAEQAAAETRERQRLIEQVALLTPDVLYVYDIASQNARYITHDFGELLGFAPGEFAAMSEGMRGLHCNALDMPHMRRFHATRAQDIPDGEFREIEFRMRTKNEEWRWIYCRETVFARTPDGKPSQWFGIARDVTERRLIIEALTASEERLTNIIALSPFGILVVDEASRILLVNQELLTMFHLPGTPDSYIGTPSTNLALACVSLLVDPKGVIARIADLKQRRASVQGDEIPLTDGRIMERDCFPAIVAGNYRGHVWQYRDITERKRAEQALADTAEKQERIAVTIQKSLLRWTPLTAFPTLTLHPVYEPASDDALIGGDIFDAFPLDERNIALILGDVMGKGLPAATDAAEIKFTLRAFLREGSSPTEALHRLNQHLIRQRRWSPTRRDMLICATAMTLDVTSGAMQIAVAGMEAPLRVRPARNRVESIKVGGTPAGIMETWLRDGPETIHLDADDILVLYTDGLTEARADDVDFRLFGPTGVRASLRAAGSTHGWSDLDRLGSCLIADAKRHARGTLTDDLCLVLLRRGELPSSS